MLKTRFITANGNLPVIAPFIAQGEDFNTRPYKRSDRSLTASFFLCAFNRRSYERSDLTDSEYIPLAYSISIHAPTRGATGVKTFDHAGSLKSGLTLYLGSRKSEKYIRLYEKDFEQKDFVNYKDRLELVLKNEYATFEFFNKNELIKIASTYMNDLEWQDAERQGLWADMKNGSCEISPKIKGRKSTLEEKTDYILETFGKTLRAYVDQYGSDKITSAIHGAVLSENEIRMINNERVISFVNYKKLAEQRSKELYSHIDENLNDVSALFEKSEKEKFPVFEQLNII